MKKKIKLSKIENDMLFVGTRLSTIKSLIIILQDLICNGDNVTLSDTQALVYVLLREFEYTKKRFNKIEAQLNL